MLQSNTASTHTCPTPLMTALSSATSKVLNDTGVCSVWRDLPAALSGGDSLQYWATALVGVTSLSPVQLPVYQCQIWQYLVW